MLCLKTASVTPLCNFDLLCQRVRGRVVQDSVPTSVGLHLGLTKHPEFCSETRFIVVVCAKDFGWQTRVLTKAGVGCHSVK